jgi:very-short-patch-repair endonuclease
MQQRARQPRHQLTPAESKLWRHLRDDQLNGFGFRRQYPMGQFVVDFYCPAGKLVVEVDGDVHAERREQDAQRTKWLEQHRRCRVLRFTNNEVLSNVDGVLAIILASLRPPP